MSGKSTLKSFALCETCFPDCECISAGALRGAYAPLFRPRFYGNDLLWMLQVQALEDNTALFHI